MKCPACGSDVNYTDPRTVINVLPLSEMRRRVILHLADNFGARVSVKDIAEIAWDDGKRPKTAEMVVKTTIQNIRKLLVGTPLRIVGKNGRGGGFSLVWRF